MQKKLTITVDEHVYAALHKRIGRGRISHFIELLVIPHIMGKRLYEAYEHMAKDEAREAEATAWAEDTIGDIQDEPR